MVSVAAIATDTQVVEGETQIPPASEATPDDTNPSSPATENGPDTKTDAGKDPKKIKRCKYSQVAGSRIPQRICMTGEDWNEMERRQEEAARSTKNRNSYCSEAGPC